MPGEKGRDLMTGMHMFIARWAILVVLWAADFVTADLGLDNYAAAGAVSAFLAVVTVAAVLAMAREKFQQALLLTLLTPRDRPADAGLHLVPGPADEAEEAAADQARLEAGRSKVLALLESARRPSAATPDQHSAG